MVILLTFNRNLCTIARGNLFYLVRLEMKKILLFAFAFATLVLQGCAGNPNRNNEDWQNTRDLYRMVVHWVNQNESYEKDFETLIIAEELLIRLMEEKNAFIIDVSNFRLFDGVPAYMLDEAVNELPVEISPYGHHIRVSMNYFNFNPIEAIGNPLEEQIIWDDNTLNILVPEQFRSWEEYIIEEYRNLFWFQKIEVENIYNSRLGNPNNETKEDELFINIIYIQDGQSFFTFDDTVRIDDGNRITDPIVTVYTMNIHPSFAFGYMTNRVIFQSNANNARGAYAEIKPFILELEPTMFEATAMFREVTPVFIR